MTRSGGVRGARTSRPTDSEDERMKRASHPLPERPGRPMPTPRLRQRQRQERPRTGATLRTLATAVAVGAVLVGLGASAGPLSGQYFGRNKVQYDYMQFQVLETPHFQIYFYPVKEVAIQDVARMSERWYERLARMFQHDFDVAKPLIFYADHADFQQTNTLGGFISEGTGGVTESLKDRVIMPLTGSYASTDHVLGHELVHAFQFDLAKTIGRDGVRGLVALPLWLIEGMAEYLSVGRDDPHTAMWMRDATLREDFPTIQQMSSESRFFPYRFGQALWAYVGGTYGDDAVMDLFRRSLRIGFEPAIWQVLGIGADTLSAEWARRVADSYLPLMEGRQDPADVGRLVLAPSTGSGSLNVAPSLSPDGRYLAFLSERDLFSIDLFLADAATGRVVRKLSSALSDTHFDAIAYTETSGTFSPDGSRFAFVVFAGGGSELAIVETEGGLDRRVRPEGIGAIDNPAWSPDGRSIVFTGMVGGLSDLFLYDLETEEVRQLTKDKHADVHPTWAPDGRTIAFATDRGPETDFDVLTYSELRLALLDVQTGALQVLEVFGNARHSNPQFSPDGTHLYFLSDHDGFSDVYRYALASGATERITRLKTGVSGITSRSPALSVASRTGELAFTVFTDTEFHVYALPADPPAAVSTTIAVAAGSADPRFGRTLPPSPDRGSRVEAYLADPLMGLEPAELFPVEGATPYRASLALDYLGQPYFGASAGRNGFAIQAAASAFFSDMLGNRNLAVAVQQNGTFRDLGAQVVYANFERRWDWAVQAGHIPTQMLYQSYDLTPDDRLYLGLMRLRILETSVGGQIAYPFSTTRRVELGGGLLRYGFDVEEERYYYDRSWSFLTGERDRTRITQRCSGLTDEQLLGPFVPCLPDPLNLAQASVSYVGDNSVFGFTSPIRGGRFRVGLEATVGTQNFLTGNADWRRYYSPWTNLTVAVRGLHVGRYGRIDSDVIQPMYLGNQGYLRGYSVESLRPEECVLSQSEAPDANSTCPAFTRLIGHRLGVANVELRVPLLGFEQFGLIKFPYLPTELVLFADGGLAWDADNPPTLEFSRSSAERVPVFSAGVSARVNFLGMLIIEAYRAYPFQRPARGAHWGFLLSPGW